MDATAEGSGRRGEERGGGKLRDPGWHSLIHSSKNRTHFTSKGSCSDPAPRQSESVKYTPCYKEPHLVTKLGSNQKRTHTQRQLTQCVRVCVGSLWPSVAQPTFSAKFETVFPFANSVAARFLSFGCAQSITSINGSTLTC